MKIKFLAIVILLTSAISFGAKAQHSGKVFPSYSLGIHTGVDIGAAVPFPPSEIGGGSKMNAVPNLTPELGVSGHIRFDDRWSLSLETTYKQLGIDARAKVANQRFQDPNDSGLKVDFAGQVEIGMRFAMLEVPLYAGYRVGKNENRIVAGLYFSRVFKSKFSAQPIKGIMIPLDEDGNRKDDEWTEVSPSKPIESQHFDSSMDNWDIGFLVGYEWRIIERVHLGVRFSMGFKDIFKPGARFLDYQMLHMRGNLVLSYKLFQKR